MYQPFLILNEYLLRFEPLYQRPEMAKHGDTIVCPGKVQDMGCFDDDVVRLVGRVKGLAGGLRGRRWQRWRPPQSLVERSEPQP